MGQGSTSCQLIVTSVPRIQNAAIQKTLTQNALELTALGTLEVIVDVIDDAETADGTSTVTRGGG